MPRIFDLRSDTITRPSEPMRKFMAKADVGDDVYGEDPSVNALEQTAARITGKKAAIFVPSGSMGNLIPIYLLGGRGNEILTHENSHVIHYEMAALSAVAGVLPVSVPGDGGILTPDNCTHRVRPRVYYMPRTSLITIENTHNIEGGTFYSLDQLRALSDFAKKTSIPIHMDGARLFNASIASGVPVRKICSFVDSLTFCLSKGLGAPVGSLICGDSKFIQDARRIRKMLGGGMRQAGVIASAGIYALEHNVERLAEDHENAKAIAVTLAETDWAAIDPQEVVTNILYFHTPKHPAAEVQKHLQSKGIICNPTGPGQIRMVTHLHITGKDTHDICDIIRTMEM